ncbi:Ubiquitin carboxyl-terminal hydrolase 15 [Chamberlinius hualienensis]
MAEGGVSACNELPDLESQRSEIEVALRKVLAKGEVRYLLDTHWFKNWKKYVAFEKWEASNLGEQSAHPGPIDNRPLLKDPDSGSGEMKEHLVEELDYVFLPPEAWDLLVKCYGLMEGQEPIIRNVVENGLYIKLCQVEVYLMELKLCENSNLDNYTVKKFSKTDTIEMIEKEMRELFNIPDDKDCRLWNRYTCQTYEQFNRKDFTIQDAGLYQGQVIVIEQKNDDGTWPRQIQNTNSTLGPVIGTASSSERKQYGPSSATQMSTRYSGSYATHSYFNESNSGSEKPGLCGLNNLGNTCFMNSAIQCLSNIPPLTQYFLDDHYWNELNTENPLGMRGEIAKAYAELIKIMWSGKYSGTAPRHFKMQVGKFAPQFSGYQQQDAQELMAFLLDGLHEDLNRIKKKPYIELKDADGRPDESVADEAWQNYRKRNDSVIVDLFHGLLKSTLVCPDCHKVSVTFDPFGYLSLPLPVKKERQIDVFFVSADCNAATMQYKLTVPKIGSVADLCEALRGHTDVPVNQMFVTDVYDHKIHKVFQKDECLSGIMDRDLIFIYQVSCDPETVILPVYMREKRLKSGLRNDNRSGYLFGHPLVVTLPRKNCVYQTLYEIIMKRMSNYVKVPSQNEQWWLKNKEELGNDGGNEVEMEDDDEDSESPQEEDEGIDSPEENEVPNGDAKPHYMFSMSFVNSCGNTEFEKLKDDGQPIRLMNRPYLMIDWHPKAKELFYNEKLADALNQHESATMTIRPQLKRQVIQLNECLELFTTTEKLSADDSWYCPSCKKHQQATKKFDLWSLPKVLILSFKRFSYNRYLRDKIDTLVEFPVKNLDMQKYVIKKDHGPVVYDLVAVSNHYGGMGGGHYTAYAKNKCDQNWYYFDDNSVSAASDDLVVSKAAYVLFYVRKDASEMNTSSSTKDLPSALGTPDTIDMSSNDIGDMDTN